MPYAVFRCSNHGGILFVRAKFISKNHIFLNAKYKWNQYNYIRVKNNCQLLLPLCFSSVFFFLVYSGILKNRILFYRIFIMELVN